MRFTFLPVLLFQGRSSFLPTGSGSSTQFPHPNRPGKFFYGYIVAIAAFFIWLTAWGTTNAFGLFYKALLTEFGWTRAMTAGPSSIGAVVRGILGIVMGRLTDKFGPRVVVLIFGSFLGIGYLLMSRINFMWQYYIVSSLIISIGLSTATIPVMATITRWFARKRGLMIGIVQSGGGVGGMVLSPIAGWLILAYGWRFSYVLLGIFALFTIILAALFLKKEPGPADLFHESSHEIKSQKTGNRASSSKGASFSYHEALRSRQFWMLLVIFFSFGFSRSTIVTHIAVHTTDLGFSIPTAATVLATISAGGIVGRIGMGRMSDMIGNKPSFITSFAVMAGVLLWLTIARELWMLYLFAAFFGFSWGALAAIRIPMLAEVFGLSSIATILGMVEFGAEIGTIVGPFLAGWLFDISGSYKIAFISSSATAILGLVMTLLLRPLEIDKAKGKP